MSNEKNEFTGIVPVQPREVTALIKVDAYLSDLSSERQLTHREQNIWAVVRKALEPYNKD